MIDRIAAAGLALLAAGAAATSPGGGDGAAQLGAFQTDCRLGGKRDGVYQFVATCPGRATSPDGAFAIVQRAYTDDQPPIELQDRHGRVVERLTTLSDDMPFSVAWGPRSRWFYVNHHVGSFMDRLQIFEIVGGRAVKRSALVDAAKRVATTRYPCLVPDAVLPNGAFWLPGDRIALVTISRPDACADSPRRPRTWKPLWMIGDARSGRIDPGSIRPETSDDSLSPPRDGPWQGQRAATPD